MNPELIEYDNRIEYVVGGWIFGFNHLEYFITGRKKLDMGERSATSEPHIPC